MTDEAKDEAGHEPEDETLGAVQQILINAYVRVTAISQGRDVAEIEDAERQGILERHAASLEQEFTMLEELVRQARIEGASGIYDGLRESVLDPTQVQQVVEHSILQTSNDDP